MRPRRGGHGRSVHADGASAVNAELAAGAARHPDMVLVPWSSAVVSHPEWVGLDSVHLTPAGNDALATMILDALRTCPGAVPGAG